MARRTTCLCDGEIIGIESIYTIIDGKQINKQDAVEALRTKSRAGKLQCTCGCGALLTLVAGDRNLREQHFRLKFGEGDMEKCNYQTEGEISIRSKILLKLWLESMYQGCIIQSRVSISDLEDSKRRYEFSFVVPEKGVAISYCRDRANLSDEKMTILDQNVHGMNLHYIVDIDNVETNGQYPEMMIKVQKRQGYTLFLTPMMMDDLQEAFEKSEMEARYYEQIDTGVWHYPCFAKGKLAEFSMDTEGNLLFQGKSVYALQAEHVAMRKKAAAEAIRKLQEEKRVAEEERTRQQEAEKRTQEFKLQFLADIQAMRVEIDRKEAKQHVKPAQTEEEHVSPIVPTREEILRQENEALIDEQGVHWMLCAFCDKVEESTQFTALLKTNHANLGKCKLCMKYGRQEILPQYKKYTEVLAGQEDRVKPLNKAAVSPNEEEQFCPKCGCRLILRTAKKGPNAGMRFYGCTNYPDCHYTRSLEVR